MTVTKIDKKLSCRKEAAQRFISLKILLSLKFVRIYIVE